MSVIRKSILAAIVMLVAYHFALPHVSRKFFQINGLQRGNYARALDNIKYAVKHELATATVVAPLSRSNRMVR